MTTYVIMLAYRFPTKHPKRGLLTDFTSKIIRGVKIHTIRDNVQLWTKRFKKIEKGEAVISIRQWVGKPYRSKQIELFVFDKSHNIGIEIIDINWLGRSTRNKKDIEILSTEMLAENDGLTLEDFYGWFGNNFNTGQSKCIIHFTGFRYATPQPNG